MQGVLHRMGYIPRQALPAENYLHTYPVYPQTAGGAMRFLVPNENQPVLNPPLAHVYKTMASPLNGCFRLPSDVKSLVVRGRSEHVAWEP